MSTNLPVLPVLIPMITGIILLLYRSYGPLQRGFSLLSSISMLFVSLALFYLTCTRGILVFCAGGWDAPFGVTFVLDRLACIMVLTSSILSFTGTLFSLETIDSEKETHGFYALWQFLIMGINGTFVTGDMFNLFVFFEIMLIASYTILVIGSSRAQLRETFKYLAINVVSAVIFLIALGCLYAVAGTLNMADLAQKLRMLPDENGMIALIALLLFVAFGVKGAIFPFYVWLPQVHTVAAASVSSIFSGLLIKVGVYALLRVFTLIFVGDVAFTHTFIAVVAVCTMVLGVFGAVSQMNYKRILAYHSISQVGYMIAGLGLFTPASIAGAIYFIVHHAIVKSCLFLTAGVAEKITGTKELQKMGGLMAQAPLLSWLFFIAALSLAGVPPLSGFFGKLTLIKAAAAIPSYFMIAFAMAVGVLTLFSMIKIFLYAYWHQAPQVYVPEEGFRCFYALIPCIILVLLTVLMGIFAQPILSLCDDAAAQLINPEEYISTVMHTVGGR